MGARYFKSKLQGLCHEYVKKSYNKANFWKLKKNFHHGPKGWQEARKSHYNLYCNPSRIWSDLDQYQSQEWEWEQPSNYHQEQGGIKNFEVGKVDSTLLVSQKSIPLFIMINEKKINNKNFDSGKLLNKMFEVTEAIPKALWARLKQGILMPALFDLLYSMDTRNVGLKQ